MQRIILTGATGFLGKIISLNTASTIIKLGRHESSDIIIDLSKPIPQLPYADIVVHAAGKAHAIPKTEKEKQEFFDVNVGGTKFLLSALEVNLPKSFIFISSVSVYGLERGININEDYALLAKDPYGLSKIQAEGLVMDWCKRNNVVCTILRLPLLAGARPPGNLGAMIRGIAKGYYFNIDGGRARKSVLLAENVATIIPKVAITGGIYNLTDGCHPSFKALSSLIAEQLQKKEPYNMPLYLAELFAKFGDLIGQKSPINSSKLNKITSDLTFDDSRARTMIGWCPTPVLKGFKIK